MVRELQPDILINNRSKFPEDFGTPEQQIRAEPEGRAWEACMTFNDSWGYTPIDRHYKDGWETVGMLIQCAVGGGTQHRPGAGRQHPFRVRARAARGRLLDCVPPWA